MVDSSAVTDPWPPASQPDPFQSTRLGREISIAGKERRRSGPDLFVRKQVRPYWDLSLGTVTLSGKENEPVTTKLVCRQKTGAIKKAT